MLVVLIFEFPLSSQLTSFFMCLAYRFLEINRYISVPVVVGNIHVINLKNSLISFILRCQSLFDFGPLSGWRKVSIGVYTPIGVQYPDRGILSFIFSSQKVENFWIIWKMAKPLRGRSLAFPQVRRYNEIVYNIANCLFSLFLSSLYPVFRAG